MRLLLTIIFMTCLQPAFGQWAYKGLGGVITNQLTIDSDTIYASTSNGLYCKPLNSTDTTWQLVGLAGKYVVNTAFFNSQKCISIVEVTMQRSMMYISGNRGRTPSFASADTSNYYPYNFGAHIGKPDHYSDTMYLMHHNMRTFDGGGSWQTMNIDEDMLQANKFVYVAPGNSSEIYVGGENGFMWPSGMRTSDACDHWTNMSLLQFFAGDNAMHNMRIRGDDMYVVGEGVVCHKKLEDTVWTQLVNTHFDPPWALYYFGLDLSPVNDSFIYVTGYRVHGLPYVSLLLSPDRGLSWDSLTYAPGLGLSGYGLYDLVVHHMGSTDVAWMGGTGVYTYARNVAGTLRNTDVAVPLLSVYPNPVNDELTVTAGELIEDVSIYSVSGVKLIASTHHDRVVHMDVTSLPAGVYIVYVNGVMAGKLVKY